MGAYDLEDLLKLKDMKLTNSEKKIIAAICESYPFSYSDIYEIYKQRKSFDETIKIIEVSIKCGETLESTCNQMYFFSEMENY